MHLILKLKQKTDSLIISHYSTYKSLKGSCSYPWVCIMTVVLQNGQGNLSVIGHMTQETNQLQAFNPHSMVDVVDLLSR